MSKKKKRRGRETSRLTLRDLPFTLLVTSEPELAAARKEYAGASPEDRRAAAAWAYDSSVAGDLLSLALRCAGEGQALESGFESGVLALAIDPLYAPALLTVGSHEYQHQRPDAAMELFMTLTQLPQAEPELEEIIDKAGCFLLDQKDGRRAAILYRAATQSYPDVGRHWSSLSYCLAQQGALEEAIFSARKALALKEDDPYILNDLGWTLVLGGLHEEARAILERAASLAPLDYELPRNNLKTLEKRIESARIGGEGGIRTPDHPTS